MSGQLQRAVQVRTRHTTCLRLFGFGPHCAPYRTRCLLLHTGALYRTSEEHDPIAACRQLHMYGIAIFLATFVVTLLSITVSHVT